MYKRQERESARARAQARARGERARGRGGRERESERASESERERESDAGLDCHRAGAKVFIAAGDRALAAEAIARQIHSVTRPARGDLARQRNVAVEDVDPLGPEALSAVVSRLELRECMEGQGLGFFHTGDRLRTNAATALSSAS